MSTEVMRQSLLAGVPAKFGAGSLFLIVDATDAISVVASTIGNSNKNRVFNNVPAGFKFKADSPDDGFDVLTVTSATDQDVSIAVGNDDVDFTGSVSVAGTVKVKPVPASTLIDNAPVVCANGAQTTVADVNDGRARIGISFQSDAAIGAGTVFFRAKGGANNLQEVQAGLVYTFEGTYGIDVYNNSGADLTAMICEES